MIECIRLLSFKAILLRSSSIIHHKRNTRKMQEYGSSSWGSISVCIFTVYAFSFLKLNFAPENLIQIKAFI